LAARNVLLTDDYVVKICDFGLSKDVYLSDMYVKRGDGKLPIKWMAIESIVDQMFTMKSDVWSFGVLCWELFSLGANPYPGIPIDEHFHRRLQNGYRMERPHCCPVAVHELMSNCWQTDAQSRPNFDQLTTNLYELLDQSSNNSYVNVIAEHINDKQADFDALPAN
jgi:serine/threonine protein kinase